MKRKIVFLISFLFLTISTYTQSKKITIKVKDEKNKVVPGAIILLDNIKQRYVTNLNGVFKSKLDFTPKTISAFHPKIGITKVEYNGEQKITLTIRLGKNDVITQKNPTNELTDNKIQFNSIYDYLRGNVSGVNVTANNIITIRGYNTFNGNMTPLFVLNGSQVPESIFANVLPTEIKKITVLKGSDTASYGIRGANGVIMVFTE